MASALKMLQDLNTLVVEYLDRRPEVVESFLNNKKVHKPKANKNDTSELTLEDVYFSYFGEKHLLKVALLFEKLVPADSQQATTQEPLLQLPLLPPEVLSNILKFCSVEQLQSLRILSKSTNDLCCNNLRNLCVKPILFDENNDTRKFLSIVENRIEGCGLPFGAFHFAEINQDILRVVELIGSQLKLARFCTNDFLLETLKKLPNLQKLILEKTPNFTELGFEGSFKLHRLRYINFSPRLWRNSDEKNLEYFKNWLALAPVLQEIKSRIFMKIDSATQLIELFHSHRSLRKVSMFEVTALFENFKMSVSLSQSLIDSITATYTSQIKTFSNYVQIASIPDVHNYQIPSLPVVTSLELRLRRNKSEDILIRPGQFRFLNHVTLDNALDCTFFRNHRDITLTQVDSLTITNTDWNFRNSEPLLYHHIFPRVRKLGLGGLYISKSDIDYFADNFPELTSMQFLDLNVVKFWNKDRERSNGVKVGKKWPFSILKDLKEVEFKTTELESIVVDIVALTLSKSLQALDSLIITWTPFDSKGVNYLEDDFTLFYALNRLKYHKSLKLDIIEQNT